ncbi:MAG TPA: aldo/keto reductase [Methanoregula sp.]|nr:aldo/keto reductase [Methanoregula sp.]
MLYRTVPKTGEKLSILGFGFMRLPQRRSGGIDEERAIAQLRSAIDRGINYVDTAPLYHFGRSEPILAQALSGGYREKVNIATKLPPWSVRSREDMDRILATQLETLRTDHIDFYLLHSLARESWEKMKKLGVKEFLDAAKKSGKIRNAGFSFHGDLPAFREIVDAYGWEFCQIQYNYLDEQMQAGTEGLRYAAGKGLAVMVMEPLRGGNLAGPVPDEVRKIWDRAKTKRSPAEWGLRWVWDHPEVTVVLSGMNDEAQIDENIRAAETALPGSLKSDELALVAEVRDTYRRLMKVGCTGCRYCMPCPAGVNIPECFALYNSKNLFPQNKDIGFVYLGRHGGLIGKESYAGLCMQCGKCEKICPQKIAVPERLAEVAQSMEGRGFRFKVTVAKAAFRLYDGVTRLRRRVKGKPSQPSRKMKS